MAPCGSVSPFLCSAWFQWQAACCRMWRYAALDSYFTRRLYVALKHLRSALRSGDAKRQPPLADAEPSTTAHLFSMVEKGLAEDVTHIEEFDDQDSTKETPLQRKARRQREKEERRERERQAIAEGGGFELWQPFEGSEPGCFAEAREYEEAAAAAEAAAEAEAAALAAEEQGSQRCDDEVHEWQEPGEVLGDGREAEGPALLPRTGQAAGGQPVHDGRAAWHAGEGGTRDGAYPAVHPQPAAWEEAWQQEHGYPGHAQPDRRGPRLAAAEEVEHSDAQYLQEYGAERSTRRVRRMPSGATDQWHPDDRPLPAQSRSHNGTRRYAGTEVPRDAEYWERAEHTEAFSSGRPRGSDDEGASWQRRRPRAAAATGPLPRRGATPPVEAVRRPPPTYRPPSRGGSAASSDERYAAGLPLWRHDPSRPASPPLHSAALEAESQRYAAAGYRYVRRLQEADEHPSVGDGRRDVADIRRYAERRRLEPGHGYIVDGGRYVEDGLRYVADDRQRAFADFPVPSHLHGYAPLLGPPYHSVRRSMPLSGQYHVDVPVAPARYAVVDGSYRRLDEAAYTLVPQRSYERGSSRASEAAALHGYSRRDGHARAAAGRGYDQYPTAASQRHLAQTPESAGGWADTFGGKSGMRGVLHLGGVPVAPRAPPSQRHSGSHMPRRDEAAWDSCRSTQHRALNYVQRDSSPSGSVSTMQRCEGNASSVPDESWQAPRQAGTRHGAGRSDRRVPRPQFSDARQPQPLHSPPPNAARAAPEEQTYASPAPEPGYLRARHAAEAHISELSVLPGAKIEARRISAASHVFSPAARPFVHSGGASQSAVDGGPGEGRAVVEPGGRQPSRDGPPPQNALSDAAVQPSSRSSNSWMPSTHTTSVAEAPSEGGHDAGAGEHVEPVSTCGAVQVSLDVSAANPAPAAPDIGRVRASTVDSKAWEGSSPATMPAPGKVDAEWPTLGEGATRQHRAVVVSAPPPPRDEDSDSVGSSAAAFVRAHRTDDDTDAGAGKRRPRGRGSRRRAGKAALPLGPHKPPPPGETIADAIAEAMKRSPEVARTLGGTPRGLPVTGEQAASTVDTPSRVPPRPGSVDWQDPGVLPMRKRPGGVKHPLFDKPNAVTAQPQITAVRLPDMRACPTELYIRNEATAARNLAADVPVRDLRDVKGYKAGQLPVAVPPGSVWDCVEWYFASVEDVSRRWAAGEEGGDDAAWVAQWGIEEFKRSAPYAALLSQFAHLR